MKNTITSIEIKDFLLFKGVLSAEFCPGINVITGENGSGKTTLMKVMYRLRGSSKYSQTEEFFFAAGRWNGAFDSRPFEHLRMEVITNDENGRICIKSLRQSGLGEEEGGGDKVLVNGNWALYNADEFQDDFTKSFSTIFGDLQNELVFTSAGYKMAPSVFIPVNHMLAYSRGLLEMIEAYEMDFDATQVDVLRLAQRPATKEIKPNCKRVIDKIGKIIGGIVLHENGRFYIKKSSGQLVEFSIEASGFTRLSLLWKLLRNGLLESGSVLFWDEPEASINPTLIPDIVDILLELSRNGVQIFLATHDYNLMKYFSMARKADDKVAFYSLYKTGNGVACEREDDYDLLEHNTIISAEIKLIEDEIKGV